MLTLGIDDAGRGPLIGSMVLAGAVLTKDQEKLIKSEGATDSKLLTHTQRVRLANIIEKNSVSYKVISTSPDEIDNILNSDGTNLNTLEAQKAADIINALNPKTEQLKVIIDCPSVNTVAWKNTLMTFVKHPLNLTVSCEHKADLNHTSAAAGSILAKVKREEDVAEIKGKYGDIGSGYPSDPKTKKFLKEHGEELKNSGIFRKTWATWKKMFPQEDNKAKRQKTLGDF